MFGWDISFHYWGFLDGVPPVDSNSIWVNNRVRLVNKVYKVEPED